MIYRTLGFSGASISSLCLGTMTFGRETSREESWEQIDTYVAAGGNVIDTSDSYGPGTSEEIIGEWVARAGSAVRNDLVIATKARFPVGPGPNSLGLSRKHLSAALDASLRRLRTDTVDLYQMHAWDPHTPVDETLRFIDDAVAAGKVHYFGVSNVTGWQLERFAGRAEALQLRPLVSVQTQYNLLSREVEWEILPAAAANRAAVLTWSPLAGGWLTGKYSREAPPTSGTRLATAPPGAMNAYERWRGADHTWDVISAVQRIAEDRGVGPAQVAIAWLLGRPHVTSVVLGARSTPHLSENMAARDLVLDDGERMTLDEVSEPRPPDYPYGELGREQRRRRLEGGR